MVTVGERLREERIKKNLSIEEVARATKIRVQFIRDIENGNFTRLPSSAYASGFIKNYITFLGLPSRDLLAKFRREYDTREHRTVLPEGFTSRKKIRISRRYWGRYALIACLVIIPVLLYIFYQYRGFFLGPSLVVTQPTENTSYRASEIIVKGRTDANVALTVNDVPTFVDSSGRFQKDVSVFTGRNTIVVRVVNSFGKLSIAKRNVVVKE